MLHDSCSGGGLAGRTAAAAGSCWTCWRYQECSAPSPSRVLCCRLCLTLAEKKTGMERSGPKPSAFCWAGWPGGSSTEEHLLQQGNVSAIGLHLITSARSRESVYTWSQNVRRLDDSLLPCRLWPAGWGGPAGCGEKRRCRCHADRLPGLLLSAGLMALQTSLPGLVSSAAPPACLVAPPPAALPRCRSPPAGSPPRCCRRGGQAG